MGLKKEIQKIYGDYYRYEETTVSKKVSKREYFTNWSSKVSKKTRAFKERLCLVADRFDKYLDCMCKNRSEDLPEGMYECVKRFVDTIAGIDEGFFIYVAKKGEQWKDIKSSGIYSKNIEEFLNIFVIFGRRFSNSEKPKELKDLIVIFKRIRNAFCCDCKKCISDWFRRVNTERYDLLCNSLNRQTISLIENIICSMEKELCDKKRLINSTRKCITVSDERYFHDRSGKGFKGGDEIESAPEYAKIFPAGKPLPYEVKQAKIGDCYLMSVLISLAKINPKAITDCFTQGLNEIEKKDDIEIRFFYYKVGEIGEGGSFAKDSLKIIVNKKKIINRSSIKGGALWPKLIEKAYAVYRSEGYDNTYHEFSPRLDSGCPDAVIFAITGERQSVTDCSRRTVSTGILQPVRIGEIAVWAVPDRSLRRGRAMGPPRWVKTGGENPGVVLIETENSIIETIREKLREGRALVCGFNKNVIITDKKNGEKVTIYTDHAYAIVGVNDEERYVRLVNPWKIGGRTRTKTDKFCKNNEREETDNPWESDEREKTDNPWKNDRREKTYNPWKNDRKEKTRKIKKERKFLVPLEGGHIAMPFNDFKDYCRIICTSDDLIPV